MAVLNTSVLVHDIAHGSVIVPAGEAPEWVIPLIVNPAVWATPPEIPESDDSAEGDTSGGEPSAGGEPLERPNESGPGSALDKWVAYAAAHEVEHASDATRDEIVAAVAAAGK